MSLRSDKRNDQIITTIVRRLIPGDYEHFTDASHPALENLGLGFSTAATCYPEKVVADFLGPTLSTRPPWVKMALEGAGEWVFILDSGFGSNSAANLWMIQAVERPVDLLARLERCGVETDALVMSRRVKGMWMVAVQATILKDVIKKSARF
jgi:hypothetical protein